MAEHKSKHWYERHPRLAFFGFLLISILVLDLLAALLFIPIDYNSYRCPHPEYHHGLLPGQNTQSKWGYDTYDLHTNSLGFKDADCRQVSLQPGKDRKRILFIGDSFTESVGMEWEESFPGLLQAEHPSAEILNAGVVSYSPLLYYLKTKYLIEKEKLEFDELFVCIDNSDPLNEITYKDFEPYSDKAFKKLKIKFQQFSFDHSYIYYSVSNIINASKRNRITQSWDRIMGNAIVDETESSDVDFIASMLDWSYKKEAYEKWGKEGLNLAKANMEKLSTLCKEKNVKVTVVIYPWPSILQNDSPQNPQVVFWEQFCNEQNINFVNLYPAFFNLGKPVETIRNYFGDGDVHWNRKGHRVVADQLSPYIK